MRRRFLSCGPCQRLMDGSIDLNAKLAGPLMNCLHRKTLIGIYTPTDKFPECLQTFNVAVLFKKP